MTPQDQLQLVQLARSVQWRFYLDSWEEKPLRELLRAVRQSQTEILAQIEARAATLSEWREERSLALLDEMSDLTLGLRQQLGESISEITAFAGAESYLVHNDILSFGGMVNGFNNVALTASQIKSMVVDTPVGGRTLQTWIDDSFDWQIKDRIKQEIASGMLQGEGYPKMAARLRQGLGLAGDSAVDIARSYVQTINVDAAHAVAKANSEFMKGWKWRSAAENGAFYVKSGKGRGRGVCALCLSLDAKDELYPLDGGPEIPAHVKCRCIPEFITKSWRDLGILVDEIEKAARPYTIRGKGIDPETGEIQPMSVGTGGRPILGHGTFLGDYEDFFKTMDLSAQRQTIGPRRLELYQAGKIKGLGDLVTVEGGKARLKLLKELTGD